MDPLGLLTPGRDHDYGSGGERPAWLEINWGAHVRDVDVDGRRVRVADVGDGPGTPLVLIHGLGASWQCWLEQFPAFTDRRVIAMDLPGFGRSEMPGWKISIDAYGEWMVRLLDALDVGGRADVAGNSMGGFIGAELAVNQPSRIEHLCLISPAILWQEYRRSKPLLALAQVTEASFASVAAGVQKTARSRPRLRHISIGLAGIRYPHLLSKELQIELIRSARRTKGFVPALAALADYPIREDLPDVKAPTLLVWGKHDTLVHVSHAREIEQLIPDCETVLFERTGHVAMVERPKRFNPLLRDFLARDRALGGAADELGVLGQHA